MSGTIGLSLTQRYDKTSHEPLDGGKIYFYAAGTTTPQNAFQDVSLTIPWPNPITLDSGGNVPYLYFADGYIKFRITNEAGTTQLEADYVLVMGPTTGEGAAPSVDATTVMQPGYLAAYYGTGTRDGFVRANGRTLGNAVSGATERANADTEPLFVVLYADTNLSVSGGRGASAAADYAAGKTIALPDWRGRAMAFLDDMGNSAAGRLTATYFGTAATVLGAAGGDEKRTLSIPQLPVVTPAGTIGNVVTGTVALSDGAGGSINGLVRGTTVGTNDIPAFVSPVVTSTFTGTSFGGGNAHATVSPAMLATLYVKL